jgi:hypothetical protein
MKCPKTGVQKHREIGESETEKNRRDSEYHKYREKYESGLRERREYLRCDNPNGVGEGKLRSRIRRETRVCKKQRERERE